MKAGLDIQSSTQLKARLDLLCVGGASYDIILRVPRLPASDEKLVVDFSGIQAGGLVANTACAAARLGMRVAWGGLLGKDKGGELSLRAFQDFEVDTSLVVVDANQQSDFCVILLDPGGERTILVVPTTPSPPPMNEEILQAAGMTRVVYTLPHRPEWYLPLADVVHNAGGLMCLDLETSSPSQGPELEADIQQADIIFCNKRGLALASRIPDIASGAQRLLDAGVSCVCVTLGKEGAWGFTRLENIQSPGYVVPVVDTTGAGDCFHAAFLAAYLQGESLKYALEFANAAAALSVQHIGARTGLPTADQVTSFLTTQEQHDG